MSGASGGTRCRGPRAYADLAESLCQAGCGAWAARLKDQLEAAFHGGRHGDWPRWEAVLEHLPHIPAERVDLGADTVSVEGSLSEPDRAALETLLREFHPWRKGPYRIHGIQIDTEWRSDLKWRRLEGHVRSLSGLRVLDVGCGSGYHAWRMAGAGAAFVLGIDPSLLSVAQFLAVRHFAGSHPVHVLPVAMESLPAQLRAFDAVFSMGVLYHRRSPLDHLLELKDCLRSGGELVLETLIIDGGPGQVLVPNGRYARMRNVWFIPSCQTLAGWLKRCGFGNVRLVDVSITTTDEQRSTDWMRFESLRECLDPIDPSRTVEGHPAPRRAIFIAEAP